MGQPWRMRLRQQHEGEGCAADALERQNRVGCRAREQRARLFCGEAARGQASARHQRGAREATKCERVSGEVHQWGEHGRLKTLPVFDRPSNQTRVGLAVVTQRRNGVGEGRMQHHRRAVVEWVGEGCGRVDELQTVLRQGQRSKERRADRHRMHRRAHVVHEAGQRQLGAAGAATDRVARLLDEHRQAGLRERDRSREPVRPGPHHHRVVATQVRTVRECCS